MKAKSRGESRHLCNSYSGTMRFLGFYWWFTLGTCALMQAAEPDWPGLEQHAVEFLQQYIRIETVNPPANTAPAAEFFRAELERNGLTPKKYKSGPEGRTNLGVRLPGRHRRKKPLLFLNHFDGVPMYGKPCP